MAVKTLFLVRCGQTSPVARALAAALSQAGQAPVFVCDTRRGAVDTFGHPSINLDAGVLDDLGLHARPENWGWFCGDFCYYAAARGYPDFDHFCLIESDVFMTPATAMEVTTLLNFRTEAALAVGLGDKPDPPKFSRGLADLRLPETLGCIFPFTRVHRATIAAMLSLRQRSLALNGTPINDEAVLAGAVWQHNLPHARLEDIAPNLFSPACFETNPPHLFEGIAPQAASGVFHPVVTQEIVLARISSGERGYNRHRLRKVLREAPDHLRRQIDAALHLAESEQGRN